jgi:vacuolar-type H+-ATPase subunit E/Vma4
MTLERLVEEIRLRAERELEEERQRAATEEATIAKDRDRRVALLTEEGHRTAEAEAGRERAQKVASAKLQSRKLVYETRERKTAEMLGEVRQMLTDYTASPEYPAVLKRMFAVATDQLGKQLRVTGRAADAAVLKTVAGKGFDDTRRLNLSFDELLRLREDQVRSLLAP